jgi:hypothetical protein
MNANMGMDLSGKGGDFRFSHQNWRAILELAHEYGWEPAGTKLPEFIVYAPDGVTVDEVGTRAARQHHRNWDGGYFTNDLQVVDDKDAANIADALERALDDESDEGGRDDLLTPVQHQATQRGELSREELDKAIEELFMEREAAAPPQIQPQTIASNFASEKDYLREFITFCRAGAFAIC